MEVEKCNCMKLVPQSFVPGDEADAEKSSEQRSIQKATLIFFLHTCISKNIKALAHSNSAIVYNNSVISVHCNCSAHTPSM